MFRIAWGQMVGFAVMGDDGRASYHKMLDGGSLPCSRQSPLSLEQVHLLGIHRVSGSGPE